LLRFERRTGNYAGKSPETGPYRNLIRRRQNRRETQRSCCVLVDTGIKISEEGGKEGGRKEGEGGGRKV